VAGPADPTVDRRSRADFTDLAGRWVPDTAFDEIIAAQRQIEWDKWEIPDSSGLLRSGE